MVLSKHWVTDLITESSVKRKNLRIFDRLFPLSSDYLQQWDFKTIFHHCRIIWLPMQTPVSCYIKSSAEIHASFLPPSLSFQSCPLTPADTLQPSEETPTSQRRKESWVKASSIIKHKPDDISSFTQKKVNLSHFEKLPYSIAAPLWSALFKRWFTSVCLTFSLRHLSPVSLFHNKSAK